MSIGLLIIAISPSMTHKTNYALVAVGVIVTLIGYIEFRYNKRDAKKQESHHGD
ncbi:hypothetical protein IV40_GL001600 [Lactobacillus selangorensis]|nr:hypothetical protein IV40_GL001600 [Lactobacillus selangorensis]